MYACMYAGQTLHNQKAVYWKVEQWIVSVFPSIWLCAVGKKYPYHKESAGLDTFWVSAASRMEYSWQDKINSGQGDILHWWLHRMSKNWLGMFQY